MKIYTNCGRQRLTIETCYRKYGFPPRFKFKNSTPLGTVNLATASQVDSASQPEMLNANLNGSHMMNFTIDQYQKLLSLIQDQTLGTSSSQANQVSTTDPLA